MTVPATAPAKVRHNTGNRFRELAIHYRNLIPVSEIVRMRRRRSQRSGRRAGAGPWSQLRPRLVRRPGQKARSERRWSAAAFSGNGHDWTTGRSRDSNVGHFWGAFENHAGFNGPQESGGTLSVRPRPRRSCRRFEGAPRAPCPSPKPACGIPLRSRARRRPNTRRFR